MILRQARLAVTYRNVISLIKCVVFVTPVIGAMIDIPTTGKALIRVTSRSFLDN